MKTRSKRWYLNCIRNSGISFRFIACRLIMLFLSLMIISCTKKEEDTDEDQFPDNNSIVEDVYAKAPEDQHTIMDVRRIPVDDYLLQIDNEELQEVLESIQQFNDYMDDPGQCPDSGSLKSEASVMYDRECEDYDTRSECIYTYHYSTYTYTTVLNIYNFPIVYSTYENYVQGINEGIHYEGDDEYGYLVSEMTFMPYYSCVTHYNYPQPEEQSGFPWHKYEVASYDNLVTVFTPWNAVDISVTDYYDTHYQFGILEEGNYEVMIIWTRMVGNSLMQITVYHYSLRLDGLYPAWTGTYSFDTHDGGWTSFDDYGNVTDYGEW